MHRVQITVAIVTALLVPGLAAAQPDSPEHPEAARDLLEVTRMEQFMSESTDAMLRTQIEANPQLVQFEGVLRDFFDRHLSWENLEPEFVRLYVEHFTADELRELADFYRTDLGQKAISLQGVLFSEGSNIGQRIVQENMGELQQMIMQRAEEIQGQPEPK